MLQVQEPQDADQRKRPKRRTAAEKSAARRRRVEEEQKRKEQQLLRDEALCTSLFIIGLLVDCAFELVQAKKEAEEVILQQRLCYSAASLLSDVLQNPRPALRDTAVQAAEQAGLCIASLSGEGGSVLLANGFRCMLADNGRRKTAAATLTALLDDTYPELFSNLRQASREKDKQSIFKY